MPRAKGGVCFVVVLTQSLLFLLLLRAATVAGFVKPSIPPMTPPATSAAAAKVADTGDTAPLLPPSICQASFPLRPGTLPMPAIGLGTFQLKEEAGYKAVKEALEVRVPPKQKP